MKITQNGEIPRKTHSAFPRRKDHLEKLPKIHTQPLIPAMVTRWYCNTKLFFLLHTKLVYVRLGFPKFWLEGTPTYLASRFKQISERYFDTLRQDCIRLLLWEIKGLRAFAGPSVLMQLLCLYQQSELCLQCLCQYVTPLLSSKCSRSKSSATSQKW